MKTIIRRICQFALMLTALSALGGCAVYSTTPGFYYDDEMAYGPPYPVYADPWYVGPPVLFNFGYRSGGGHSHFHDHGNWHGGGNWRGFGHDGGGEHRGSGDHGGGHGGRSHGGGGGHQRGR